MTQESHDRVFNKTENPHLNSLCMEVAHFFKQLRKRGHLNCVLVAEPMFIVFGSATVTITVLLNDSYVCFCNIVQFGILKMYNGPNAEQLHTT